jgi:hypothetical protein
VNSVLCISARTEESYHVPTCPESKDCNKLSYREFLDAG